MEHTIRDPKPGDRDYDLQYIFYAAQDSLADLAIELGTDVAAEMAALLHQTEAQIEDLSLRTQQRLVMAWDYQRPYRHR